MDAYRSRSAANLAPANSMMMNQRQLSMPIDVPPQQQHMANDGPWFAASPPARSSSFVDPALSNILRRPPVGLKTPIQQIAPPPGIDYYHSQPNIASSFYPNVAAPIAPYQPFQQQQQAPYYQPQQQQQHQPFPPIRQAFGPPSQQQQTSRNGAGVGQPGFQFSEESAKDAKASKAREYQEELQRQMREKQAAKQREKADEERYNKRIEAEAASYNPFGRSGGGAPIKDNKGNLVADLSQFKATGGLSSRLDANEQMSQQQQQQQQQMMMGSGGRFGASMLNSGGGGLNSYRPFQMAGGFGGGGGGGGGAAANSGGSGGGMNMIGMSDNNNNNNNNSNKQPGDFARGGNGIFGEAKVRAKF